MKLLQSFFCIVLGLNASAQLLPSIGLKSLPADTAKICKITPYSGIGAKPGIKSGNYVPDFTLFNLQGKAFILSDILKKGKPVLLISSSYTCPVFRGKVSTINLVDSLYQGQLEVYVLYTVEAHPIVDVSPYSGQLWTTNQNQTEGILFQQPKTYGDRKAIVEAFYKKNYLRPTLLLDGPCNEWWLNYGTYPNSATLIKPDGKVFAFQDWFNKAPANIFCTLDSCLKTNSGRCTSFSDNGTFKMQLDSSATGTPGSVLAIHALMTNLSATDNVVINVMRQNTSLPSGWETALCIDVCYATTTSQADVTIPPNQTQPFIFYFYTDNTMASALSTVRFRNKNLTTNQYIQKFYGKTVSIFGVPPINKPVFTMLPNPANQELVIEQEGQFNKVTFYDLMGAKVLSADLNLNQKTTLHIENLPKGIYMAHLEGQQNSFRRIIKH